MKRIGKFIYFDFGKLEPALERSEGMPILS